jgi:cell division septal protein FtsQ
VNKRLLLGALAVVLLAGALVGGRILLKKLSFFSVRRIELAGARYLTATQVATALDLPERTSIFDDTGPLVQRVAALPGVLEAKISRRLPGALRVTVREAEPIALADRGGHLVLLDSAGTVLPFDPTTPAADLPLADADSGVAGLLSRVKDGDPDLFAQVQRAERVRQDVALELENGRLLLRVGASSDEIRDLSTVADVLARQGRSWRELDGRYPPRVIVRRSSEGRGA